MRPEHVFSVVAGRGVAHFHQHVYPRHTGTPDDVPVFAPVPSGPRWTARQVDDLVTRLSARFT